LLAILKAVEKLRKSQRAKPGRPTLRLTKSEYAEARSFILAVIEDAGLKNATNAGRAWAQLTDRGTYGTLVATTGKGLTWTHPPRNSKLFLDVVRPKPTHDPHAFVPRDKVRLAVAALADLAPEAFNRHPISKGREIPHWWPSFPMTQILSTKYGRGWRLYAIEVCGSAESLVSDMVEALQENGVITRRKSDAARETLSQLLSRITKLSPGGTLPT
jgi:hypothetical protein